MGDDDTLTRKQAFNGFQVNAALMARAKKNALFMHCLPAQSRRRGDGRGARWAAVGRMGRSGESFTCSKSDFTLVSRRNISRVVEYVIPPNVEKARHAAPF